MDLRLIERKEGINWVEIPMIDINHGDTFRMFEDNSRTEIVGDLEMVAESDAFETDGIATVNITLEPQYESL